VAEHDQLRTRGRAHLASDELEKAISCFRRLAELVPGDVEALCRMGSALFALSTRKPRQDRPYYLEEAKRFLGMAVAADEQTTSIYEGLYWLALARRALDESDLALELLERQVVLTDHTGSRLLLESHHAAG